MRQGTTMVTLHGTWYRKDTDRADVNEYRGAMRKMAGRNGGWFDAVCHRIPDIEGTLDGTFEVQLPVSAGWLYGRNSKVKAAKKLFEAMMALTMCRPPKIRYLNDRTFVRTDWSDNGPGAMIK